ncbi:MAG: hypothetical protein ABGY75_03470 [Gemmataceae bacterium]|jgi:hypothetical protein
MTDKAMTKQEMKALRRLRFGPSKREDQARLPEAERNWSRRFGNGRRVSTVLTVRKSGNRFVYRVGILDGGTDKGREQWFNADNVFPVLFQLLKVRGVWKRARRGLEGGPVRRTLRWLFK